MRIKASVATILLLVLAAMISTVSAATPGQISAQANGNADLELTVLKAQVEQLEAALAQDDPLGAAKAWANAVKRRNGAWQYALMTPELRAEHHRQLAENNWSTGTSRPWIQGFTVVERDKVDPETFIYDVNYVYTDSTGTTFNVRETVVVKESEGKWLVAAVESAPDICGQISEITTLDGRTRIFVEDKKGVSPYDKAYVFITEETTIFAGRTDQVVPLDQLKVGSRVEVIFSCPALKSYPIQVGAGTIRVF